MSAAPVQGYGDDLDEIAVERYMQGTLRCPSRARDVDYIEAIRRMAARGLTDVQIAERLGRKTNTICMARHRHGIPAGRPRSGWRAS